MPQGLSTVNLKVIKDAMKKKEDDKSKNKLGSYRKIIYGYKITIRNH